MTATIDSERLGCGTPVDLLLAQLAGDPDVVAAGHAAACPYCQAAAAELRPGLDVLRREKEAPGPAVPPGVERAVLRRIRGHLLAGDAVTLPAPGPGRTTVQPGVVAELARIAGEQVPGVRRMSVDVGIDLHLAVALSARYGSSLPAVADNVRAAIADGLNRGLGLRPARIDVVVEDLA